MSGKFYDFDKDDSFDEIYSDKIPTKPSKKEYEISIPMPKTELKSTMPKKTQEKKSADVKQKAPKPQKKKMPAGKKVLCAVGIILSCLIVFLSSLVATLFGIIPVPFSKNQEDSAVKDIKKIDEYIEISDDGNSVEVVPMFKDVPESQSGSQGSTADEDADETEEADETDETDEADETEETSEENQDTEDTPVAEPSGDDEVFDV